MLKKAMNLPFLSLFKKKIPTEYFLALLFRDEQIHAVVFEQINGSIQVIGVGKSILPVSLERASDEMLLDSSDKAISIAEESLPNGIQTHKTVFGVKETWVSDMHITKTYLDKLKMIGDQLDLKPIGFLVFPEAIAHLLQKEEGAPVSAIFVEPGERQVTVTLLRAGRIIGTKEVALEEDITQTVENALKLFEGIEIFPSRIIVFDGQDEHIEKKFLTHHWSKSLPFLHVPQITTLPHDFDTRAVLFGTATQMGLDAIDLVKQPLRTAAAVAHEEFFEEKEQPEKIEEQKEEPQEEEKEEQKTHEEKEEELSEVTGADTSEYFGFVRDTDISKSADEPHKTPIAREDIDEVTAEIPEEEKEKETPSDTTLGFGVSGPLFLEGAKKIGARVKRFLPKQLQFSMIGGMTERLAAYFVTGPRILFLIPVVILLLLGGTFWYIFGIHAKVTLFVTPKVISQDQPVTFTTNGSTDVAKSIIASQDISVSEDGKVTGDATGTKTTGTNAKGTVTVFNSDSNSHILTKGTTIISSSGPKFTLDSDVTVASASGDIFSGTKPGTATVNVTAASIGTDSNLPSNTKFTVSGTSVLAAKNDNAFSGGTQKSVVVVSQKDLDNLISQLTNNLKDKAKSDIQNKVNGDMVMLPDFISTTATKKSFDKQLNDETSSINLDGTITYDTLVYKKSDLQDFTKSAFADKIPSDMQLSSDGTTYSVKDMTTKDGTTKATLTTKVSLMPKIDVKDLAGRIAGKSFSEARDILSGVPQFSDTTLTLSPNLFFLPKTLPRLSGNISITISANE